MNTPRHMLNVLRLAVALLFASALMSRCASMMTPTGGPRDSLPPVIVNMTPDNFATGRPTVGHGKIDREDHPVRGAGGLQPGS